MSISIREVRYMAELARLRFDKDEEERLAEEMSAILDYMAKLNELKTEDVPPMSHVLDVYNIYREEAPRQRISHEEALKNAPDADDNYFRVPKVIG